MLSAFLRALMPEAPPPPGRPSASANYFGRRLHPRYFDRPASGQLDADHLHSVITQAKADQMTPLLSLYREIETADDAIQGAINSRKLAVLCEAPTVKPFRQGILADQQAADGFSRCLDNSPSFMTQAPHLLSAFIWPVSVCGIRWVAGQLDYSAFELTQIPLEQLDYQSGSLRIGLVNSSGSLTGQSEYPDPSRFVVHRGHLSSHPDQWGGPFRALLFWHLFGACNRDWWARFLERFGAPFLVGKYDPDDEESRSNLESAFSEAARTFGIVATSDTSVELHEARGSVGADSFSAFHDIAMAAKTRLILGQTLSSKTDATGLGQGASGLQGEVRTEYKQWDRLCLSNTVRSQIIEPWMRYNRIPGEAPKLEYPGDPADLVGLGSFLTSASTAGLELDDAGLESLNNQTSLTLRRRVAVTLN